MNVEMKSDFKRCGTSHWPLNSCSSSTTSSIWYSKFGEYAVDSLPNTWCKLNQMPIMTSRINAVQPRRSWYMLWEMIRFVYCILQVIVTICERIYTVLWFTVWIHATLCFTVWFSNNCLSHIENSLWENNRNSIQAKAMKIYSNTVNVSFSISRWLYF